MNIQQRIEAFSQLGNKIRNISEEEFENLCIHARNNNSWFVETSIKHALNGINQFLTKSDLEHWTSKYSLNNNSKTIGIVMAGNIPLVGFHDLLCILISGHKAMIKVSSQDEYLMKHICQLLIELNADFKEQITFVDRLANMDAIIATGSDNTSRYFEYYFSKYPNIIRRNRTSIGILTGEEADEDLKSLGDDIFTYFGLGCRNVSKIFIPKGYNLNKFFEAVEQFNEIRHHHKYNNNYEYNKSIYLVNNEKHLDNGFLLLKESTDLVSPISVLYYEYYEIDKALRQTLSKFEEKIQCIVSKKGSWAGSLPFGQAQCPNLDDYADNVDTMKFIESLK
ncbi:acyl-CoA reductase [Fulvivirga lutimaris]|uniref:acyl-CoA reductase n=1 Tax=Fulvivirga lutimaris TaxID=1819566 RepID=UPI0012BB7C35|nr:acyl-CoA reductase [Fulvivirga lutimaris]MTI40841.1 acyl-CoA reductase [Fulvivirga lutimaris]